MHGWGESAASLGGFVAPLVHAGYRVVGIDLPAHGASSGGRTNVIDSGQAIADVARHFDETHGIVAHSMGANVALWALTQRDLDAERAAFLAPNVDLIYALQMFEYLFALPPKAMLGLRRYIESRFGPTVWDEIRGNVLARELKVPGLVCHDPDDATVPFEGSKRLVTSWPFAELVEAPGLGHGGIARDPAIVDRVVRFMQSQSAPAMSSSERSATARARSSEVFDVGG